MPFCPVCKAAGKSQEEYTSHFVKDRPGGTVVCPILLNQECSYCHEKGHTPKYCPKLKAKQQRMSSSLHNRTNQHQGYGWQHAHKPIDEDWRPEHARSQRSASMQHTHGFVYDGACSPCASSPPPQAYPPLSTLRPCRSTPMRVGVAIPSQVHLELQQQHENEEFVSAWAGRSTAYTPEEEAIADAAMEEEAEFQRDYDIYYKWNAAAWGSRTPSSMSSLEDCTWG